MEVVYHTPISVRTLAKNGSERFGANASCTWGYEEEKVKRFFGIDMHGNTKADAYNKLMEFLTEKGVRRPIELPLPIQEENA